LNIFFVRSRQQFNRATVKLDSRMQAVKRDAIGDGNDGERIHGEFDNPPGNEVVLTGDS
jgi:hypothetical protein